VYFRIEANIKKTIIAYPAQAGAVDEECFITSFEDVPTVNLFSARDLEEQMKIIRDTVGDDKKDWKQRMDSVSVARKYENIFSYGLTIAYPLSSCISCISDEKVKSHCTRGWH